MYDIDFFSRYYNTVKTKLQSVSININSCINITVFSFKWHSWSFIKLAFQIQVLSSISHYHLTLLLGINIFPSLKFRFVINTSSIIHFLPLSCFINEVHCHSNNWHFDCFNHTLLRIQTLKTWKLKLRCFM
jgi:hypothetical protein